MQMAEQVCQSCGMPMGDPALWGTDANGEKNADYCTYCYRDGGFTSDGSVEDMINECVPFMVESGMTEEQAHKLLSEQLPTLKRWKAS